MNADGSDKTFLAQISTAQEPLSSDPVWSPDGSKVAFRRFNGLDDFDIWVMYADGSGQRRIASGGFPAWSPDSKRLTFYTSSGGLATVNADGSGLTLLPNNKDEGGTAWAPDWQALPAPTRPESKAECKKGGYKEFGFKSQGQCIASLRKATE
jgi:Tol biopolymer transport system component